MAVKVRPGLKTPTHDISLSDGVETWGLKLDGGPRAIQEIPQTPSTLHFSGGGTKFGDWEPGYSHIENRDLSGGRGSDDYSLDPSRFYDSMNAFTMIPGKAFPAPQWKFATGLRTSYENLPGNVNWKALTGSQRYMAAQFTVGGAAFDAQGVSVWLRRSGSPSALTVEIWTDSAGSPGTLVASASDTVDIDTITDYGSEFYEFNVSAAASLSASTAYWVVAYAAAGDNAANNWALGIDKSSPGSKTAPDGSAWAAAAYSLYYRVTDVDVDRKWHFFELSGGLYAVDQRADGGSSSVYMNGERGVATAGSSTTLTDSNAGVSASWATDQWAGWHIKITNGIGKGQWRRIISNTGTVITVERAWDINPAATPLPSQYVIYGGDSWQDISPTSGDLIDGVVLGLTIFDNIAAFAQGTTTSDPPILKMRWYASATPTPRHQFDDDGTNKADLLHMHYTPGEGAKIWRINNTFGTGSSATSEDWGTDLTFDGGIPLGDKNYPVTNLLIHDDKPFIFKVSGIHTILNHRLMNVNLGMGFIKSENNGEAAISHKSHLYFSWGDFALQRLVGRDVVSIGPASGSGLPDERRGKIAALASHPTGLFAVIDAEARISSVMVRDDDRQGWHEIFRSWAAGKRAQNLYWQTTPGTRPRLWINVGGEMVYQEWPQSTFNPLEDGGMAYQHECAIVMADIDLGVARLPKFFKEMTLLSENLSPGVELNLEYQLDKDIGSAVWTQVGSFYQSPEDTLQINRGNTRKIRLRLRLLTDEAATPPVYIASVLEGFARTPVKYQWNIRVRVADNQLTNSGGRDHDPDKFANWLKQAAQQAKRVRMRAIWEQMDDRYVIVEPPNLFRQFTNKILGWWGGSMSLTIREA